MMNIKISLTPNRNFRKDVFNCVLILVLFSNVFLGYSQTSKKRVKLVHTDELAFDKSLVDAQRLLGNVHLEYEGTHFYCDSAYLYSTDDFDAFSRIRIVEGSGYNVSGDFLHFDKKSNTATLRDNITLRDKDMTLTTNNLVYNLDSEVANYYNGGKIVSNVNKNTLTSNRGIYHSKTETFFFRQNVLLKNPEYTVKCDTMQYNSGSEVTYFFGPTNITGDKTGIYCENGYYNTKKDISRFGKNAVITSETTILKGDSIYYDGQKEVGEVFRNVTIRDTTENYIISGNYGRHNEKTKESFVTDQALLTQEFDSDSLYMHADTLLSKPDTSGLDVVYAFHDVRIFKEDLQGRCDSLVYAKADSSMHMFENPVLWSMQNQITGDSISLQTSNGKLQHLLVKGNAFIISDAEAKGDSIKGKELRFNQIKGRRMTGNFIDNDLRNVHVEGNGQVIYFPTNDDSEPVAMGHNKGECSNIFITIEDNALKKIRMEVESNSVFTPMKMTDANTFKLENFKWLKAKRPMSFEDLFTK